MKNVLLIENKNDILPKLMSTEDIRIAALICGGDSAKNEFSLRYPDLKIYSGREIANWGITFVSADDIKKYQKTQLKVERYLERNDTNASHSLEIYYSSLSFWINFFNNEKIDCVIMTDQEHGSTLDTVPIDVAKSHGLPVLGIEVILANSTSGLKAVKCYNSNKYLKINELDSEMEKIDVKSYMNYKPEQDINDIYIIPPRYKKIVNIYLSVYVKLTKIYNKITCRSTDAGAVKERGFIKLFRIKWTISSYFRYITGKTSHKSSFEKDTIKSSNDEPIEENALELLNNCRYMNRLKKYYDKNSLKKVMDGTNAILYALHFEPEASIMNRTTYNSQLYNIKMLSESLPEGWVLYVKEHPDQFKIFHPNLILNSKHIKKYRNKNFYDQIKNLKNVYLINTDVGASDMIKHDEIKAVATINGTISFECMYEHKPVIMFDAESMPYEPITEVYSIQSYNDLTAAVQDISNMTEPPKYDGFENKLSEYLIYNKINWNKIAGHDDEFGTHISKKALHNLIVNADKLMN